MAIGTATALALGGSALLGGGASLWAAHEQSDATKDAANISARSTNQAVQMQLDFLRETRSDIADAVEQGIIDLDTGFEMAINELNGIPTGPYRAEGEINQIRALLANPDSIKDTGSYKFQYGQGLEALQSGFSKTSGGGISGRTMKAAEEYGQNFAATMLDKEINRLFGVAETDFNIENADRTGLTSKLSNIANLYSGLGTQKANLRVGGATQTANLTGNAAQIASQGIQQIGSIRANEQIAQSNINTQALSNLTSDLSSLMSLYAIRPELFKTA